MLDGLEDIDWDTVHPAIQIALFSPLADAPIQREIAKNLEERVLFSSTSDYEAQVSAIECLRDLGSLVEVEDFGPTFEILSAQGASLYLAAFVVLAQSKTSLFARLLER